MKSFRLIGLDIGETFHLLSLMALGWLLETRVPGDNWHLNSYADSIGLVMHFRVGCVPISHAFTFALFQRVSTSMSSLHT